LTIVVVFYMISVYVFMSVLDTFTFCFCEILTNKAFIYKMILQFVYS